MILLFYLIFALTSALSPLTYTFSMINDMRQCIKGDAIFFSPFERVTSIIDGYLYNSEDERIKMNTELNNRIQSIDGISGIGKTALIDFIDESGNGAILMLYNDDLIARTKMPLQQGNWFADVYENEVPIIVGGSLRDSYQVGDSYSLNLNGQYTNQLTCKIVGILDRKGIFINLIHGATMPTMTSIAQRNEWAYSQVEADMGPVIIAPLSRFEFVGLDNVSKSSLLFFDVDADVDLIANTLDSTKEFGRFNSLDTIASNQFSTDLLQYAEEIALSIVLFIFSVFGLGGYALLNQMRNEYMTSIYYLCGMSKRKAVQITFLATLLITLVPGITSALISPMLISFEYGTSISAYLLSFAIVMIVVFVSSLISINRILKYNPYQLFNAEV